MEQGPQSIQISLTFHMYSLSGDAEHSCTQSTQISGVPSSIKTSQGHVVTGKITPFLCCVCFLSHSEHIALLQVRVKVML